MSLLVPVAAWPSPPVHSIRRILVTSLERSALATGSDSGQVCLWCVEAATAEGGANGSLCLSPRVILLGHTAEISWLACCAFERSDALVSVCRSGFLNVWDPMDGRCLSSTSGPVLGGAAATQGAMLPQHTHAVIGGESLQLCVVELSTMTVRCVLTDCQNWTHALATCSMGEGRVRLLSLEMGGELRSWDLRVQGAQVDAVPRGATRAWPVAPAPPLIRQCEINADAGVMLTLFYDGTLEVMALEPASADGSADDGGSSATDGSGGSGERMALRLRLRSRAAWQGAALLRTAGRQAVTAWRESGPPEVLMLPAHDAEPLELGELGELGEAAPASESVPTDGEARSQPAEDEARDDTPAVALAAGATLDLLSGLAPPPRGEAAQLNGAAAANVRAQCGVGVVSRWLMRLGHPMLEGTPGNVAVVGDAAGQLHMYQLPSRSEGAMTALGSTSISATWPMPPASLPRVTASTMVAHEGVPVCLLLGHADGSLCAVDLPGGRSPEWMRGRHAAEVTALLALRSHGGNGRRGHFVSAAADGTVLVWRHRELQPLASFREHCSGVRALLQAPPGVAPHMAHYFLSVSHDNTIALFEVGEPPAHTSPYPQRRRNPHTSPDLDELRGAPPPRALSPEAARRSVAGGLGGEARCMGLLAGHAEPVLEVLWRPAEELLCCHCAPLAPGGEALLYVWQLSSGRLERVLRGAEAQPHLTAMSRAPLCQTVPETTPPRELRSTASKRLLENVRLSLGSSNAPLSVVIFNVKRLAAEAKKGAQEREEAFQARSSPSRERRHYSFGAGDAGAATEGDAGGGTLLPGEAAFLVEASGNETARARADGADQKRRLDADEGEAALTGEVQISSQPPPPQTHDPAEPPPPPPDVAACQSALSYMTCWGVDAAFDRQCHGDIGLRPPLPQVTYGVRGHGGHFSFLTPRGQAGTAAHHRWQCSAHLTALHSIAAVSLSNTLMMCPGHDEVRNVCSSLVTHFSVVLPEKLPLFCAPSLSLLARHYVDAVEEVQQAARALMEGTLQRMSNEVRQQIVNAWAPRVLRLGRGGTSPDLTSPQGVSLLVLAVLASRFAVSLEPDVSSVLVTHLLQLLSSPSELTRIAAAELLGKGYATWRAHLADPAVLIKQLFRLSADQAAQQSAAATGSQAQAAAGKAGTAGAPSAAASLPNRYHAALLSVAVVEPRAFCQAMGEQAVLMGGVASARVAAVTALISLVKARGVSLEEELPAVVEAVIKPLDPSVPSLREGCLSASTSALRELVKRYPMMAFNQGTQRLAVGTVDGVVLIYDLRTATKWRILQGHEAAISALAFSPGGESVASLSALDGTLRWWQAGSSGLFSFLGLQGSCIHVTHVKEVAGRPLPAPALLQLEWTSASQVMLSCNKQTLGFYSPKA